jgi:hypothetical protein
MSKRNLFTKLIKVVNTTKQCSLKDMYNIVTYNLSFDFISLVYDFNTVDLQQTAILLYFDIYHISINKLFWSEYQDRH